MKNVYRKPTIVEYGRDEIMELIGPVKTQYPCVCDSQVQPNPLDGKQFNNLQICFTTEGDCPDYERVLISLPGSAPAIGFDFTRAAGTEIGNQWCVTVPNFQYLGAAGVYDVIITLTDASGAAELYVCETSLIIQ